MIFGRLFYEQIIFVFIHSPCLFAANAYGMEENSYLDRLPKPIKQKVALHSQDYPFMITLAEEIGLDKKMTKSIVNHLDFKDPLRNNSDINKILPKILVSGENGELLRKELIKQYCIKYACTPKKFSICIARRYATLSWLRDEIKLPVPYTEINFGWPLDHIGTLYALRQMEELLIDISRNKSIATGLDNIFKEYDKNPIIQHNSHTQKHVQELKKAAKFLSREKAFDTWDLKEY